MIPRAPNRLAANNLIEGSHRQVLELLAELSGERPADQRNRWRRGAAPEPRPDG